MEAEGYNHITIEKKWQQKWFTAQINNAQQKNNKKFFIHFAYPGVSGYLHVGHMRGFTYCDIIARYKRMTSYDVLFPAGFHASGIPSIAFAKKVERKDADTISLLKKNGCKEDFIESLTDPQNVVNYFSKVYVDDYWKRFGFLIDYTRLMTTISPGYKKFIQWQFQKLHEKQLLIQKPHYAPFCKNCGPVAVDKSETDVSTGGSAEILEFTIIKFKMKDGTILPAATLRPETIFGVTNMWVNPDVEYQKITVDGEQWICSEECVTKLMYQLDHVELLKEKIQGKELLGKTCFVPFINREIPILSGSFADPRIATGIVMSVPAHAPYDWIALVESKEPIQAIKIIDVQGFGDNPAKEACDQLQIKSQTEKAKLDEATDIVYKKEFHTGVLNDTCGSYAGLRIAEIKDAVKNDLIEQNLASSMREFSEEVICRCKEPVMIKKIPDQWFIKYSDYVLTEESKEYSQTMNIYPSEYKTELPKVLDWFGDRAVIRKGSWLGTEFPFKKGWIIEPISDSTLYPAYYIISKYVNNNIISANDMGIQFFDYVFLGIGTPQTDVWRMIKEKFDYWYPVDINLGGKEHKTVHFPVYIMNHVAIMPEQKRPRGLFVHWWVTQQGKEKISKSKGGAEPIHEAASTYGVDAMRLYYAHIGSPFVDVEWDPETVLKYKNRVAAIWRLIIQIIENKEDHENKDIDIWVQSVMHRRIKRIINVFETFDLRIASNEIYFDYLKDLQWYLKRGGSNQIILRELIRIWLLLMVPITPHIAEELWEQLGFKPFISNEVYPQGTDEEISEKDEVGEYMLINIIDDINEILRVTQLKPTRIVLYTSPQWKYTIMNRALELAAKNGLNQGVLIKETMSNPTMKPLAKQISTYVNKIVNDVKKLNDLEQRRYHYAIDEKKYLQNACQFLQQQFSCEFKIFNADDADKHDPAHKSNFAVPLRPAIYIE